MILVMASAISFFHQWKRKLDQYWQQKPNIATIWNVGNSCRTRLLLLVGWRRCWHWFGYESELRIMACFRDPGKPTTIFVTGLYVGSISNRSQGVAEQQKKTNDHQRVLKFMTPTCVLRSIKRLQLQTTQGWYLWVLFFSVTLEQTLSYYDL